MNLCLSGINPPVFRWLTVIILDIWGQRSLCIDADVCVCVYLFTLFHLHISRTSTILSTICHHAQWQERTISNKSLSELLGYLAHILNYSNFLSTNTAVITLITTHFTPGIHFADMNSLIICRGLSHHIRSFLLDVITHPCRNFNDGLAKPKFKARMGDHIS